MRKQLQQEAATTIQRFLRNGAGTVFVQVVQQSQSQAAARTIQEKMRARHRTDDEGILKPQPPQKPPTAARAARRQNMPHTRTAPKTDQLG